MEGIADYEFVESLGSANYGENYLARAPERLAIDAEYVVVKVMTSPATDSAFRRATRELKHFASVGSDKLVTLYDAGRQGGAFYYAMEHLTAGSLQRPTRSLSRVHALTAVKDAAEAAHALHEHGIAHRDIKPANIMLTGDGGRLSDLGLSQALSPGLVFTGLGNIGLEFTDPAILVGAGASRASDIWSLGACLHFAATGGQPLYGALPTEPLLVVRAILGTEPALAADLDADTARVIRACLARNVVDRPGTAIELAMEIGRLLETGRF